MTYDSIFHCFIDSQEVSYLNNAIETPDSVEGGTFRGSTLWSRNGDLVLIAIL